jgi:putative DNA primase/helicase
VAKASAAALAVGGRYLAPVFEAERPTDTKGPTDWNDLHQIEGLHLVRAQVDGFLSGIGWTGEGVGQAENRARTSLHEGSGEGAAMPARITVEDAVRRYWGTYGLGGKALFDEMDRILVHKDDVLQLLPRHGWEQVREHPDWRVARKEEIGFDASEQDRRIRCNLYGGWPTEPAPGNCERTLELLQYLCNGEPDGQAAYQWLIRWLAYPIQHPGAKMQTAVVMHGPQGTGKSLVFEAVLRIYGEYGVLLGQEALEDKFNADWASKKLFVLADEILARSDMWHLKNRLKGFITGDRIRVNPKNMPAYTEKNSMNLVFLSNEHQPAVLERDDRRHCVIWTPEKLDESIYAEVSAEMEAGGVAALHHHLMNIDLGDFKPWTKPPSTQAKHELIDLGLSSEERFLREWMLGEIENDAGEPVPFGPCLGSHLYRLYEQWCRENGELRPRPSNQFVGMVRKRPGWSGGKPERTQQGLNNPAAKVRKMVIPSEGDIAAAAAGAPPGSAQIGMAKRPDETKAHWLTRGYYAMATAMGWD